MARIAVHVASRASRLGTTVGRAMQFFSSKQPNLSKVGESKFTRTEQKDKAKEVAKKKNWKRYLNGEKPGK